MFSDSAQGPRRRQPLIWQVSPHYRPADPPTEFVPATVPGAVQLDWARSQNWPPYWHGENFRQYRWMEDEYWTYEARLELPPTDAGKRLFFVSGGIEYQFVIKLNGREVHAQEGMYTPVEIELTGQVATGDMITITIFPAPKSWPTPEPRDSGAIPLRADCIADLKENHTQANASCKPSMSYGWDFHPRLIPLGIWQETYLEFRPLSYLADAQVDYTLSEDFSSARLSLTAKIAGIQDTNRLRWVLRDPQGQIVHDEISNTTKRILTLDHPALWWPHDHGTPHLYTSRVEYIDCGGGIIDAHETRVGFRRIRMIMAPGQWERPMPVPPINQRSRPPMTFEVNGRAIFAKGANWVSPAIFPGTITVETYGAQLTLVRDAHMNLLRVWGGAALPKDSFYQQCDEMGLMVWQDFPLSCNVYSDDPAYLAVLDQESRSLIAAIRPHPSVVCWCGGNELFNSWSRNTDQSLFIRLLQSNCYQLDPHRPFFPTTPLEGVGHGPYFFRDSDTGKEAWALFQASDNAAYCEFGCPAPASAELLREIIPAAEIFPPCAEGAWKSHHAFEALMKTSWLCLDAIEHYFGPAENLEQLVERGQLLQSEGYKGLYEEVRRQKPVANIAMCWCLNEPWPTAANNSVISWPARPKPGLAAIAAACRPLLASARIRKFTWSAGEVFDAELFWLNDRPVADHPGPIEARIETPAGETWLLHTWEGGPVAENGNLAGPRLAWILPDLATDRFDLILKTPASPKASSRYTLIFR